MPRWKCPATAQTYTRENRFSKSNRTPWHPRKAVRSGSAASMSSHVRAQSESTWKPFCLLNRAISSLKTPRIIHRPRTMKWSSYRVLNRDKITWWKQLKEPSSWSQLVQPCAARLIIQWIRRPRSSRRSRGDSGPEEVNSSTYRFQVKASWLISKVTLWAPITEDWASICRIDLMRWRQGSNSP